MWKKRSVLIILLVLCSAVIGRALYDNYHIKKMSVQYKEDVRRYLVNRYEEEMCFTGDWSFYDAVYFYTVYPVQNESLFFRAQYQVNKEKCEDDYLLTYAEAEAEEIIQKIVNEHYYNSSCRVSIVIGIDDKEKLEDFYRQSGKPWEWSIDNDLGSHKGITINIFQVFDIETDIINEILGEIVNCDFAINNVTINFYKEVGDKKPVEKINYTLTSDGYELKEQE